MLMVDEPGMHVKVHYVVPSLLLWDVRCSLLVFQRIEGLQISRSLSMFGQSISGQIDADNNGYVGKYEVYIPALFWILFIVKCGMKGFKIGVTDFNLLIIFLSIFKFIYLKSRMRGRERQSQTNPLCVGSLF